MIGSAALSRILNFVLLMPWDVSLSIGILTFLFLFLVYKFVRSVIPSSPIGSIKPRPTNLKLQFSTSNVHPTAIIKENIWYWTTLKHIMKGQNAKGKTIGEQIMFKTLFLVFDQPIPIKEIRIDGNGADIPRYEVKTQSARHAVIVFSDDLTHLVLNIEVTS